jgi:hypothetical protein
VKETVNITIEIDERNPAMCSFRCPQLKRKKERQSKIKFFCALCWKDLDSYIVGSGNMVIKRDAGCLTNGCQ